MEADKKNISADIPVPELSSNCSVIKEPFPGFLDQLKAFEPYGPVIYISEGLVVALTLVVYCYVAFRTAKFAPSKRRTMILWVTATPFVMSILSFIGIIVPKSNAGCTYVKTLFMPWVLMNLVNLTLDFHGGVTQLLPRLMQDKVTLMTSKSPCCCFGLIWKNALYNKRSMRLVRGLVYQVPLTQFIIVFTGMVFEQVGIYTPGYIGMDDSYLWLNLLNFATFFMAMYGVNMIIAMSAERLAHIRYSRKVPMIQMLIIVIKSQTFIFAVLRTYGVITCIPPHVTGKAYKNFMENSVVIAECFLISIPILLEFRLRNGSHDRKLDKNSRPLSTISGDTENCTIPSTRTSSTDDSPNFFRTVSSSELLEFEFVEYL